MLEIGVDLLSDAPKDNEHSLYPADNNLPPWPSDSDDLSEDKAARGDAAQ